MIHVTIDAEGEPVANLTIADLGPATPKPEPERYKDGRVKPKQPAHVTHWDERLRRYRWSLLGQEGEFAAHADMDGTLRIVRRALLEWAVSDLVIV